MNQLDGDETALYSETLQQYTTRDIVQFVPFRKLQKNPEKLAQEVLKEIPK